VRQVKKPKVAMAQTYGIALITWSPLAMGFLSGRYHRGEKEYAHARLGNGTWGGRFHFTEDAFRILDAVEQVAREKGERADHRSFPAG
jgi:aryl-alcohol dehydrogenase-like predicted oxidoreductase